MHTLQYSCLEFWGPRTARLLCLNLVIMSIRRFYCLSGLITSLLSKNSIIPRNYPGLFLEPLFFLASLGGSTTVEFPFIKSIFAHVLNKSLNELAHSYRSFKHQSTVSSEVCCLQQLVRFCQSGRCCLTCCVESASITRSIKCTSA